MSDGAVLDHHPVAHNRQPDKRWTLWCNDCDWTKIVRSREAMDREWFWHLCGQII